MSHKHRRRAHDSAGSPPPAPPAPAAPRGPRRRTLLALVVASVAAIGVGIWNSHASLDGPGATVLASARSVAAGSGLAALKPFHDFGSISMARGLVSHEYAVTNTGSAPVTITGVTTSCMCTTATLLSSARRIGPFGMPGHGRAPDVRERLAPGESVRVEVVFDPAAHGPAGVGRIDRVVTLATAAGAALDLRFVAMVRP